MNIRRAVIYARVSGDDVRAGKDGRNLAEQIRMGREYAEGKGYTVVAELAEDERGASGAKLDLPQLARVEEMARAGQYDVLVVRELDRLSRRLAKQLIIEEELRRAGVEIEYVLATYEDNPEGNLSKQIKAVISEYERLKINERMTRGRRVKARTGSIIARGHALYGYDLCERDGKTGYEINPKEADIVKLIFRWCAAGWSIGGIRGELTRLGIPTPADNYPARTYRKLQGRGEWGRSSIQVILKNETYIGAWYYGRCSPKVPGTKHMVKNGRETWIKVDVPPIIDAKLWDATRRVLDKNRVQGAGNLKNEYLLRGHLVCGNCGGRMIATSNFAGGHHYYYYSCRSQRVTGEKHGHLVYPSKLVDQIVWAWMRQLLLDPEAIREGLAAYKQQQEEQAGPISMHVSAINGLLIEKRAALQRLLDLYLSGEFHKDMLIDKKAELERTIAELEKERAVLLDSMRAQSISDEQEQTLIDFGRRVSAGLGNADTNFKTQRSIVEALGVQAILARENEQKTLRIKCILGEKYCVVSPRLPVVLSLST